MSVNLFVCQHRKTDIIQRDTITNIQVGKDLSQVNLGFCSDNTGENISSKNKSYCELTAMYWMWKNCRDDIVGMMHYRRFFNFRGKSIKPFTMIKNFEKLVFDQTQIEEILKESDIILPKRIYHLFSMKTHYKVGWYIEDLNDLSESVKRNFPQIYPYCQRVLKGHSGYFFNMLIAKKEVFDEYANFVFTTLFDIEEKVNARLQNRNSYQKRVYGFLAEYMMKMFVDYKVAQGNFKVKEIPVSVFFDSRKERRKFFLREIKFLISSIFLRKRK